jgi:CDP-glycerol glycerophosphotransferase
MLSPTKLLPKTQVVPPEKTKPEIVKRFILTKLSWIIRKALQPLISLIDVFIPKDPYLWIFPSCYKRKLLYDNPRLLFEEVLKTKIRPVVLVINPEHPNHLDYKEYAVKQRSFRGLWLLLRGKVVIIRHGLADIYWSGIKKRNGREIINLWHGIPLKTIRFSAAKQFDQKWLHHESKNYSSIIASSEIDRLAMSASFKLNLDDVWLTGLPRNDLLHSDIKLSRELKRQDELLQHVKNDRLLIVYAPTFRAEAGGGYQFTEDDRIKLEALLDKHNCLLGVRCHVRDKNLIPASFFDSSRILDVGQINIPETQILLRNTDILITDYSSIWADFLLMDRPIVGFCHDFDYYFKKDRGFLYDYTGVFPGPIARNFEDLIHQLSHAIESNNDSFNAKRAHSTKMFHQFGNDGQSSVRVLKQITDQLGLDD